ncbi:gliding motility-associated peptidyl-prolyl isomerase GldI [Subsaximicrobium wynnwilliamsii]|uniref:Peptidyl-prolyl cis-trans isomerase n=1 Tax=Subsaximicrobium wynnwilliamsii TaxID=291179 RepID=A0A5C6ZL38_9FLAO|nr:gliding motility-associated peptidyl-prolyl isomerase GldI [Subsaximicrobium wynnwilliamsii]TXD84868.1 gliding motility-associated peptidyl-prolyl isomerase GldI [Subsaximicrobium wynnwilliamsii]TXD90539.1 gliding motility-associated peptidyl-prolyl isomerase GldI [Subsaximicrobium wynnwilliamsii]TXE05014.1 gliding motility-associated peptidyl-prolyl isomerase GldI [Subsaximicrobium wynnwilliamsii]
MKPTLYLILLVLFASCKSPDARRPESVKSGSFIKESAERNKKLNDKEQQLIEEIIAENSENNYIASNTGFWYHYNTKVEKDTITADFGDLVNFDYNLKDLKGRTIYASEELGNQDYVMDKEELFTGLREGLKLMKPGETVTFMFPSQKAFGYYGDKKRIGTNIPLISQVTVNAIKKD